MSVNHGRRGRRWRRLRDQFKAARIQPCGICDGAGGPIAYEAEAGSPLAFELDHINPLSHDATGAEDPTNLRPVHAICNRRRGTGQHAEVRSRRCPCGCGGVVALPAGAMTSRDWHNHPDRPGWAT